MILLREQRSHSFGQHRPAAAHTPDSSRYNSGRSRKALRYVAAKALIRIRKECPKAAKSFRAFFTVSRHALSLRACFSLFPCLIQNIFKYQHGVLFTVAVFPLQFVKHSVNPAGIIGNIHFLLIADQNRIFFPPCGCPVDLFFDWETSGTVSSASHLEIVCLLTPSFSATSSCDKPRFFLA